MFGFVSKGIYYGSWREHPDKAQTRNSEKKAVGNYQLKETFPAVDLEKSGPCKPKANIKASKLTPLPK